MAKQQRNIYRVMVWSVGECGVNRGAEWDLLSSGSSIGHKFYVIYTFRILINEKAAFVQKRPVWGRVAEWWLLVANNFKWCPHRDNQVSDRRRDEWMSGRWWVIIFPEIHYYYSLCRVIIGRCGCRVVNKRQWISVPMYKPHVKWYLLAFVRMVIGVSGAKGGDSLGLFNIVWCSQCVDN